MRSDVPSPKSRVRLQKNSHSRPQMGASRARRAERRWTDRPAGCQRMYQRRDYRGAEPIHGATTLRRRARARRTNLKAAVPAAGDVLIAGGADASNRSLASAEFFDPSSGQFFLTGSAISSRAEASATALSPSQVLLDGGFSGRASIKNFSLVLEGSALNNAEIFDETTGAFSRPARWRRRASALPRPR